MDILKRASEQGTEASQQKILASHIIFNANKSDFIFKSLITISGGLVKNEKDARIVLASLAIILFLIAGIVYVSLPPSAKPLYKEETRIPGTF